MKKTLLAATAFTALSFSAFSADLPARTFAPVAPAPIFSWTGFYVGANAGFIRSMAAATDGADFWSSHEIDSSGSAVLGGIQAGYNYQVGAIVFGLEADLAATNADAKNTTHVFRADQHKTSALGTVRGRVGYALDRTLLYVTGGLAHGNVKNSVANTFFLTPPNAETSGWRTGYAVGGGVETAVNEHWTVKAEALYYNVGSSSAQFVISSVPYPFKTKNDGALARVGVNFNIPARTFAPVAPAPIFSWNSFYVGTNAGFIRSMAAATDRGSFWAPNETIYSSGSGVLGGIQAGYNYQVGAIVLGLEADLAATSADAKALSHGGGRTDQHKTSALGTVRGRIGYAFDRTLLYVTGGLAYGNVKNSVDNFFITPLNVETSGWRTGYAVGGGVETAINEHWTVKAEALYYNVGSSSAQFVYSSVPRPFETKNDGALARVGVNFKL